MRLWTGRRIPRRLARMVAAAALALVPPLATSPALGRGAPDSFADLASRLLPTVVNIATTQTLKPDLPAGPPSDLAPDSALQGLFKDFLQKNGKLPLHVTSLGSGFIIDPSGLIVTNSHVIDDAENIMVTLNDGTALPAKVVGRDDETDLALVRVQPKAPLPATRFGDSDRARVGDWVIAIGDPFGLGSSVTAGIVSARNRDISAGPYDDFIQTDAPINRGNSGGPLFDMNGNVVGIASAIYSPSGGSVGVGFAIPSNMAREVIAQLREFGEARRGWLGVRIQQVTGDIAEGLGLSAAAGALVVDVTPDGPAARAGIKNGDLITEFDGRPVPDSRALPRMVADTQAGRTVALKVLRDGRDTSLSVVVARLAPTVAAPQPVGPSRGADRTQLGFSLAPLDREARAKYELSDAVQGVVITDVDPEGPVRDQNFQPGDVIVEVQHHAVRTPEDVSRRVEADARAGRSVDLLLVSRAGRLAYVALRLDAAG